MQPRTTPPPSKPERELSRIRREMGARGFLPFAQTYLPEMCSKPPSSMHKELSDLLEKASKFRGQKIAIAAPRGYAKSTLAATAYILWSVCYKQEDFIVLISDTAKQAQAHLETVKDQLVSNPLLRMDFPWVCEPQGARPGPPRWNADEIVTMNGVRVTALGSGQKIRGRRHKESRPTLVIMDDIENEEAVRSPERREKLDRWFRKAVLKAGTGKTNFIVVGTVLYHDSLLARLTNPGKEPGWESLLYKAVLTFSDRPELWEKWETIYCRREEFEGEKGPMAAQRFFDLHREPMLTGTKVLWPEVEDYYALMKLRLDDGVESFDSEKQNMPISSRECLFPESDFQFWDDEFKSAEELLQSLSVYDQRLAACDPSLGGKSGDYSAIITAAYNEETGIFYVLDAEIERRTPDEIIDAILELNGCREFNKIAVETNQFQDYLADALEARSMKTSNWITAARIAHHGPKEIRIQSLQPYIKRGRIKFSRRHRTLLEQLRQFPYGHDDGPDALALMLEAWSKGEFAVPRIYVL